MQEVDAIKNNGIIFYVLIQCLFKVSRMLCPVNIGVYVVTYMMDIPVSTPWIPGPNKTLAKIEMASTPLFGIIYKAGSILVDRKQDNSRRESFSKMQETLEQGIHLCLYPEGTRNKTDKPLQPFFDGAFLTAIKSQKPIIPGVIFNTGKILPHNKKFGARPMAIPFHFLEPIPTKGLTTDDAAALKQRVFEIMESYYLNYQKQ
jgi:1-acyl-sn-glycerol-3-phosphate acyltransferase